MRIPRACSRTSAAHPTANSSGSTSPTRPGRRGWWRPPASAWPRLFGLALFPDVVDDAPVLGFFGAHEGVPIEDALDGLQGLSGVLGVEFVEPALGLDDVLGVALDVGGLAGEPT